MSDEKLKVIFLVQAEGRGHMTQAITLSSLLRKNGHQLVCTFIGKSKRRHLPDFFIDGIGSEIIEIDSPNFVTDKNNKSIDLFKSITHNIPFLSKYLKSLKKIHRKVNETKPDLIINFYDLLGGFYFRLYKTKTKHVCIGHQFLVNIEGFPFIEGRKLEKSLFLNNNWIVSQKSALNLALSFRPYDQMKNGKTVVVPPMLRKEILELKPENGGFILGYMVNDGYGDEIIAWHQSHSEIKVECFWDRKGVENPYVPHDNIAFHQLNGELFKEKMRTCKGYVSTAGFESICEAMYLDKPVLMIPVEGQYEQACNAKDAGIAHAGISSDRFDIQLLLDYIPKHKSPGIWFKEWVNSAEQRILKELTSLKTD